MCKAIRRCLLFCLLVVSSVSAARAEAIEGTWSLRDGASTYHIRIAPCSDKLCGGLTSLDPPNDASGRPKVDHRNPQSELRSRRLLGLRIITDVVAKEAGWVGTFYNPDDGGTYTVTFTLLARDELNAHVCCVVLIGRTLTLNRLRR